MKWSVFWLGGLGLLSGVASVAAQGRDVDFSQRVSELENKKFETEVTTPQADSRWMSRRFDTRQYDAPRHRYADRRFHSDKIELFRTQRFDTEELDYDVREVEWFRQKDKEFSGSELRVLRDNTLHQFDRQDSFQVGIQRAVDVEEALDQLSLADLNRFNFRRNQSDESGIPSQTAGGEPGGAEES